MTKELPPIPPKRYFRIGEASALCGVKDYVLRYWEQEFPQIRPKKIGAHRYYQQKDIEQLRVIRSLVHDKGFTIAGAKLYLKTLDLQEKNAEEKAAEASEREQILAPEVEKALQDLEKIAKQLRES
jgi:DNA-binding transcriptional MerR regulator